jgi:site-specific DNA-methyltransferase (adenine-specific)
MSLINTIACGDCREILPTLPAKSFQLAFADPPYWVNFEYNGIKDSEMAYVEPEFLVNELLRVANVVMITPGIANIHDYPKPYWVINWYKPAAMGRNVSGGVNSWEPILVYGKCRIDIDVIKVQVGGQADASFHTCPKPVKLLNHIVEKYSSVGQSVLDPFSGSGTTCKAAYQLGREYLGIEIDPKIVELSLARLHNSQPPLLAVGGLTPHAADAGDSPAQQAFFTPEVLSTPQGESTPALRR